MEKNNNKTAVKLGLASALMFGFGFLLVPLYDVICDVTGLNGKTGYLSSDEAAGMQIDETREITVRFDTNVNSELPWRFTADTREVSIRPGSTGKAVFTVTNLSDRPVAGQAIPSVTPSRGSVYFDKTECFCFSQQLLQPGESRQMSVRFVINPGLPASIKSLMLSYTFFQAPDGVANLNINKTFALR